MTPKNKNITFAIEHNVKFIFQDKEWVGDVVNVSRWYWWNTENDFVFRTDITLLL